MHDQNRLVQSVAAGLTVCQGHEGACEAAVQHLHSTGQRTPVPALRTVEAQPSSGADCNVRRLPLIDFSGWHSPPFNPDLWEAPRILRCIERGSRTELAQLRQAVQRNPQVCREVLRVTANYARHPYQPDMYEFWHRYAAHHSAV